jgi:aminoglycoside phosphotransferase family enzyme
VHEPDQTAASVPSPGVGVSTEAKAAFLRRPKSYPKGARRVDVIETHMSWVFLTATHAYKLKKPVAYDDLDFRTLAARKHFCEEEVRLNRRLARETYLGTVPLTATPDGQLALGGFGEPVDWLVKMRRQPAARMLDRLIERGELRSPELRGVILKLAEFYRAAPPIEVDPRDHREQFECAIQASQDELTDPVYALPAGQIRAICAAQRNFLSARPEFLEARVAGHRIIEAHGDLRPEHICVDPEPQIIDCLEFHRPFRLLDPADELSFLALECERLGADSADSVIFDVYRQVTDDAPPDVLLRFYKSFRACSRAKVAIWHLRDDVVREPEKWPRLARIYLDLATRYAEALA